MTDERGRRRHPAGKINMIPRPDALPEPIPVGKAKVVEGLNVDGPWTHRRTLDPVRSAALTAAIQAYGPGSLLAGTPLSAIFVVAKDFERYLAGEEADGQ